MVLATPSDPALAAALSELTALGLRMARAITEVTEAEQRTVSVAASWLPVPGSVGVSLEEATRIGLGIDTANAALAVGVPRMTGLSHAFERIARAVRRSVALSRRLEQGWPPPRGADTSRAMLIRQVARGVAEVIRAHTHGRDEEAAERLFADLADRLDDPEFERLLTDQPVAEVIALLCREMGLPAPRWPGPGWPDPGWPDPGVRDPGLRGNTPDGLPQPKELDGARRLRRRKHPDDS